jgi:hypothetical protein
MSRKIITLCIICPSREEWHKTAALDEPKSSYRSQSCIARHGGGDCTVSEEDCAGKGVSDDPFANSTEDLDNTAKEDIRRAVVGLV